MSRYSDIVMPGAEAAIWETALAVEAQAVDLVAVDMGELRNSISIASPKRVHGFNSRGKDKALDGARVSAPSDNMTAVVGTSSDHAAANEFGRPDMPNYPAQPFLRPAALSVKQMKGQVSAKAFEEAMKQYMVTHPYKKA